MEYANAGQSTPQCVIKLVVVITGYLKWPQIYHVYTSSPIHVQENAKHH